MEVIYGTQSTLYINKEIGIVKKAATQRGKQDMIDQISFYTSLPKSLRLMFPHILNYQNGPDEYFYSYNYISGKNLRDILLNNQFNSHWIGKTAHALNTINRTVHTYRQQSATQKDIYPMYIQRCSQRVTETKRMLGEDAFILDSSIYIDGKKYPSPIVSIIGIFEKNIDLLVPNYICTTHGQLGPSHLFLDEESDTFTLIDPKGFNKLYDPIIDVCKIGKAMLFATEWLEENKYNIEYSVNDEEVCIHNYEVRGFEVFEMQKKYEILLSSLDFCKDIAIKRRILAMICADLVGGLPFAYVADGKKRVIALLAQIARASDLLFDFFC